MIFSDQGFHGLVIRMVSHGVERIASETSRPLFRVQAGHVFDDFVSWSVGQGWAGVECLSGIPGSTGGVPVQNVGAYGQEASDTLVSVRALDTVTHLFHEIPASECAFGYRTSRFKHADAGRYVISSMVFALREEAADPRYPELIRALENAAYSGLSKLQAIRAAVLALRKGKSMVVSPSDPDSRSCGSFFTNPVLSVPEFEELKQRLASAGIDCPVVYPERGQVKVPAAFLIEKAGFTKGTTVNGAGISNKHALALVNRGCSAESLMDFASRIQHEVKNRFGVTLAMEPEFIS